MGLGYSGDRIEFESNRFNRSIGIKEVRWLGPGIVKTVQYAPISAFFGFYRGPTGLTHSSIKPCPPLDGFCFWHLKKPHLPLMLEAHGGYDILRLLSPILLVNLGLT